MELFICYGDERTFLLCSGEVDIDTVGRLREAVEFATGGVATEEVAASGGPGGGRVIRVAGMWA